MVCDVLLAQVPALDKDSRKPWWGHAVGYVDMLSRLLCVDRCVMRVPAHARILADMPRSRLDP